jgi:hypothetical protein
MPNSQPLNIPEADTINCGHLYIQTNERRNAIIHYVRRSDGTLAESGRTATGGAGSGVFKPISGQESAPNAFEGAGSVLLTPDRRFLITTNGGDNSVSSFSVGQDGRLELMDVKPTGNPVTERSGTAKSLAYAASSATLYVLHAFGPEHVRILSFNEGILIPRPEWRSVNTQAKVDRVATQAVLSPDERFLLVDILFDERPSSLPDGSPKLVVANAPDPDGLVVFPLSGDGSLGAPSFHDAGGEGPFFIAFLHGNPNVFFNGLAVGDGIATGRIDPDGGITVGRLVSIDASEGKPSELCWLAVTPDDRFVFATNFGFSNISSYSIEGTDLVLAQDPACPKILGDGTFRAVNGLVSSGPSDNWLSPSGDYLYQIYGNASVLVGYAVKEGGLLEEVTRVEIPYNSPQGLAGY